MLVWLFLLTLCVAAPARSPIAAPQQNPESVGLDETAGSPVSFQVEQLAEGVLLFRPKGGRLDLNNSLVVVRHDGLLVIDAQPSPQAARSFLADLKSVLGQEPRYLVLSHPHAEAAGGASAFPTSTLVIGTDGFVEAIAETDFDFGAELRQRSREGARWQEPPRVKSTLTVFHRTRLEDPARPVELLPLPPAHTEGDLLVQLPRQQIIYAGALLALDRNPYAAHANVAGWLSALNNIAKSRPSIVVPLHGPASPLLALRAQRDGFAWLRGQIDLAFVNELKAPEITDSILKVEDLAERFDTAAEPSFLRGLIDQAVAEAVEQRKKRGLQ
jgi:cyclase